MQRPHLSPGRSTSSDEPLLLLLLLPPRLNSTPAHVTHGWPEAREASMARARHISQVGWRRRKARCWGNERGESGGRVLQARPELRDCNQIKSTLTLRIEKWQFQNEQQKIKLWRIHVFKVRKGVKMEVTSHFDGCRIKNKGDLGAATSNCKTFGLWRSEGCKPCQTSSKPAAVGRVKQ